MTVCVSCIQGLCGTQMPEELSARTRDNTHIPGLETRATEETSWSLPRWAHTLGDILRRVGYAAAGIILGGLSIVLVPALALIALPIGIGSLFFIPRAHPGEAEGVGIGLGILLMGVFSPVIGAGYLLREAVS